MLSILFIVNPISGTSRKDEIPQLVSTHLDASRFSPTIVLTEYAGHAAELAAQAANDGTDIVVAVGGDGTVNEVARSLVHTNTALAIIPCGSGNGLARHLQLPMQPAEALEVINQAVVHTLDYGMLNDMPFFCTCGLGFDAFISLKFSEAGKRGLATYIEKALTDGLNYKPETYHIEDEEGAVSHEAFLISCANASQYGNNAYIAPHASMKDGLLDVVVIEPFNTIEAPQVALQLFNGTLPANSHVRTFRSSHLRITRNEEGPAHCDGDPFITGKDIDIRVVPKALNIVVNPQAHAHDEDSLKYVAEYFTSWKSLRQGIEGGLRKSQQDIQRAREALRERLAPKK